MIEGIYQIGKLFGKNLLIGDEVITQSGITYKICKINFNNKNQEITFNTKKEFSKGDEIEYKFVNLRLSGRQNQFFVTFKDLKRLFIEKDKDGKPKKYGCWISLIDEINNLGLYKEDNNGFCEKIGKVKECFYKNETIDFSKFKSDKIKDLKSLNKYLKDKLGQNEEIVFYTISIDGNLICQDEIYDKLLYKKIIDSKKKKGNIVCSICGKKVDEYFDDFARMPIKFFINDKIGFSQKLSNNWNGNYLLCEDCYISLLNSQKFLLQHAKFKLNALSYMIIPEFPEIQDKIDISKFKDWFTDIKNYFNIFKFLDNKNYALKTKLQEYNDYGFLSYFWLNYVFFEQNNQQFKIYMIIKDIPKSRIEEIKSKFTEYKTKIFNAYHIFNELTLKNFGDIYWLIPLRIDKKTNKILELPKILNLFSNLIENRNIEREKLIKEFWLGIKVKYFNNKSYHNVGNLENTDYEMVKYVLKTHQLIIFFKILEGGNTMSISIEALSDDIKLYLEDLQFKEKEVSLFLIGTLIAEVAGKQVKYGNKPILNKINFQGMGIDKIMILSNEIYEKLIQEKLLYSEIEKIYALAHQLLDKEKNNWNLKPYENVYYLLSGYSYKTFMNIKHAQNKNKITKEG